MIILEKELQRSKQNQYLDDEVKSDDEQLAKVFKDWVFPSSYQGVYEDNPLHESWQWILSSDTRFDELKRALFLVDVLYRDFDKNELIEIQ